MKNMAMSAEERKEYGAISPTDSGKGPKYPYGLCLCLNDGSLEKLGVTSLPEVGTRIHIMAVAEVTRVASNQQAGGDAESSVDLQITDMELAPAITDDAAEKLYAKKA